MVRDEISTIRVFCVDDNELVLDAVARRLGCFEGLEVAGRLVRADTLFEEVGRVRPDVVLLDIDMPGADSLDVVKRLHQAYPKVRVIILSGHVRRELVDRAFESGVWGYLGKADAAGRLEESIRRVMADEVVICPETRAALER